MLAGEVSRAAAKREASDTGRRDDAGRHGEPVYMGGVVDVALRAAGTGADAASVHRAIITGLLSIIPL
jgi:hypothetical protein